MAHLNTPKLRFSEFLNPHMVYNFPLKLSFFNLSIIPIHKQMHSLTSQNITIKLNDRVKKSVVIIFSPELQK